MAKYWRVMATYNAETQAYSAAAGTVTSPFTPDIGGKLIGIRLQEGHEAATSLTTNVQIRMSCAIWKPNTMDFMINGNGLKTVPVGNQASVDYVVDQPVQAGVPITIEGRCLEGTNVTNLVSVVGCFEA